MIQINLLIKPKPTNWRKIGLTIGVSLVLVALGFYGFWWTLSYRQLSVEKKALQDLIADYTAKQAGAAKLAEQEAKAKKEADAIQGLSKNQGSAGQAAVLQAILGALPADVTLSGVTFAADGSLTLTGRAGKFQSAMAYRDNLRALPGMKEVTEKSLTSSPTGETTFTFAAKMERGVSR